MNTMPRLDAFWMPFTPNRQFKTSPRSLFTVVIARNQKELLAVG